MRKLIFLTILSAFSYFYLQAQATQDKTPTNYGADFAKNYKAHDLYKLEIERAEKSGYALQIATFASYPNVVRYATNLQGKWFKNLLMKMDQMPGNQTVYKVLIGPFPDKNTAVSYQQFAKKKGIEGFVIDLDEKAKPTAVTLTPKAAPKNTKPAPVPQPKKVVANSNIVQTGEASYYHKKFHGKTTAYGEKYNKKALTAAHWTLPYNSEVRVCRLDNNKCVDVRINDRGPNPTKAFAKDGKPRIIDLSTTAAKVIGLDKVGVAQVSIEMLN